MQFLAEAIKKANSTDSDKVSKALLGLTIETPIGPQTIREKDHQANRGQLYGKTAMDPKYPFAIMKPRDVHRSDQVHGLTRTAEGTGRAQGQAPSLNTAFALGACP